MSQGLEGTLERVKSICRVTGKGREGGEMNEGSNGKERGCGRKEERKEERIREGRTERKRGIN